MFKAGMKEEKPAEFGETEPLVNIWMELWKLDCIINSLNKELTRVWGRRGKYS